MKVVLDTNVFVSGVFFGGIPGQILQAWRDNLIRIVLSEDIVKEYVDVLDRLVDRYPPVSSEPILELLLSGTEIAAIKPLDKPVSADPDDDKFIACALSTGTEVIITGDKHLLEHNGYRDLIIVTPSEFIRKYQGG